MGALATLSIEVLVALVFALINLQLQIRCMAGWWAKGCSWSQFLDINDLRGKYKNWMTIDMIANTLLMYLTGAAIVALGWTIFNPYIVGILAIECLALVCTPFRFLGAKYAVRNNPNLLDFNGKFKGTYNEYKKLSVLLEEKKLTIYTKSCNSLWSELLLLNKRRKEAYTSKARLDEIKEDVQKLITAYSIEQDQEKTLRAQARLNKIIKQQEDLEAFIKQVEEQIEKSENVFMDIRTKLAVGQMDNVLPDLSSYTSQVKSLEITVEVMDGGELGPSYSRYKPFSSTTTSTTAKPTATRPTTTARPTTARPAVGVKPTATTARPVIPNNKPANTIRNNPSQVTRAPINNHTLKN